MPRQVRAVVVDPSVSAGGVVIRHHLHRHRDTNGAGSAPVVSLYRPVVSLWWQGRGQ